MDDITSTSRKSFSIESLLSQSSSTSRPTSLTTSSPTFPDLNNPYIFPSPVFLPTPYHPCTSAGGFYICTWCRWKPGNSGPALGQLPQVSLFPLLHPQPPVQFTQMMKTDYYPPPSDSAIAYAPTDKRSRSNSIPEQSISSPEISVDRCASENSLAPSSGRKKNTRTSFTLEQIRLLEEHFRKDKYPTIEKKEILSKELKASRKSVKIWFQNRRSKMKRESEKNGNLSAGDSPSVVSTFKQLQLIGAAKEE